MFRREVPHQNKIMKTKRLLAWNLVGVGVLFLLRVSAFAEPLRITLPPETASFRATSGAETAMAHCLQCHSAEYITTQPPLGRAAWKASIEKMRGKYGATVPTETEAALLDYLAGAYGSPSAQPPRR